jgi:hypothetical protein
MKYYWKVSFNRVNIIQNQKRSTIQNAKIKLLAVWNIPSPSLSLKRLIHVARKTGELILAGKCK